MGNDAQARLDRFDREFLTAFTIGQLDMYAQYNLARSKEGLSSAADTADVFDDWCYSVMVAANRATTPPEGFPKAEYVAFCADWSRFIEYLNDTGTAVDCCD